RPVVSRVAFPERIRRPERQLGDYTHLLISVASYAAHARAKFMSHPRSGHDSRQTLASGISAPQRVSNMRMVTKRWMDFRVWRAEPPSDRAAGSKRPGRQSPSSQEPF